MTPPTPTAGRRRRAVAAALLSAALVATPAYAGPAAGATARVLDPAVLRPALAAVLDAGAVGVVAEARSGDHRWRGAAGLNRVDPPRRARSWMSFRAASVTKPAVAVLALQLVARGRWSLDTTIGDVLPGLWPGRSGVTVRQLLSHTSGMPEMLAPLVSGVRTAEDLAAVARVRRTDAALVRAARTQPWLFAPGTGFTYSNTGYVVVGMMLRAETGKPVARLLRERVLAPARMTRSRLARTPYVGRPWLRERAVLGGEAVDLSGFDPSMFSSAGALLTTARDLNRFHRAVDAGRLLPKRLVRVMRTPVYADPAAGLEYGLGSFRIPDPCRPGRYVHGHDGAGLGGFAFSLGSGDGRRQVTTAVNGRSWDDPVTLLTALAQLTGTVLLETCRGTAPTARREGVRVPSVDRPLLAG